MAGKRKAYTPFSTSSEAGTTTAPVEGYIDVDQEVKPTVDTGFLDSKGIWIGHVTSDKSFVAFGKEEGIANAATILAPSVNPDGTWPLDMTGYADMFIAIKPSNGGNYLVRAVMGPDALSFANLSPVNPAAALRGTVAGGDDFSNVLQDSSDAMTADVWNIFIIKSNLSSQKLLQFQITNNSGGSSDIETAFMRIV